MQNAILVVLVAEDEFFIQEIVEGVPSDGGFKNEIVASGEEAIKLLQSNPAKYPALATDINLKGSLTGWDVAKRARAEAGEARDPHDGCRGQRVAFPRCAEAFFEQAICACTGRTVAETVAISKR